MANRVRFTHEVLSSGQHAILSPDIKGFCIVGAVGDPRWQVEAQAWNVLQTMQRRDPEIPRGLPIVELEAA